MLYDLEELLERPQNQDVEASDFRSHASRMLRQQTLFRDDWNSKISYEFILRFRAYFSNLFDALGLELVISERDLTIVLKPKESKARARLPLDETVLLLALRAAFEQGVTSFDIGDYGEIEITSMDLLERYEAITGRQRPAWPRVRDILKEFKRRRFISLGDEYPDESGVHIVVRPSIREVTGEGYLTRVDEFISAQKTTAEASGSEGNQPSPVELDTADNQNPEGSADASDTVEAQQ